MKLYQFKTMESCRYVVFEEMLGLQFYGGCAEVIMSLLQRL